MKNFKLEYRPFPAEAQGVIFGFISSAGRVPRIMIDSTRDEQTQRKALRHELAHLMLGHVDNLNADLGELEAEADAAAANMTEEDIKALLQWAL
jgi:Zn-dependent peptidase ImmA (M78 family)